MSGNSFIQSGFNRTGFGYNLILQPSTGNVGIGVTSSPAVKLDVYSTARISTSTTDYLQIGGRIVRGVNGSNGSCVFFGDTGLYPSNKNGTLTNNGIDLGSGSYIWKVVYGVEFYAGATSSTKYQGDRIIFTDSNYFVLNTSGVGIRLANTSTAWVAQSDINIKHNIENIGNVLDKIKDYRCICYSLKVDDTNDRKIGFVAQDWVNDFPEIVDEEPDGTLGMKYTETIPILMRAIQEQQTALEKQSKVIDDLLERIELLENN